MPRSFLVPLASVMVAAALLASACAGRGSPGAGSDVVEVVAAESVWGDLVSQVGGDAVRVTSIITKPDVDPHDYEPTPGDARTLARARHVIVNGFGYDEWADRLLSANPVEGRRVLRVQDLLGLPDDENPHRWYSPADVGRVIEAMAADLEAVDPERADEYQTRRRALETEGLAAFHSLLEQIRGAYAGTPVGATESIATPLVEALGLRLISPPSFLDAIAEGTEPTPQDKAMMDAQIARREMAVLIVNRQNSTPDVRRLAEAAGTAGIPVVEVTETPPAGTSFQDWQVQQLRALSDALRTATRR